MLRERLFSSTVLLAMAGGIFFWRSTWADLLLLLVGLVLTWAGTREVLALTSRLSAGGYRMLTAVTGCVFLVVTYLGVRARGGAVGSVAATFVCAVFALGCLVLALRAESLPRGLADLAASTLAFLYVPWLLSYALRIHGLGGRNGNGPYLLFFLVLVTKCGDIGGYVAGRLTAARPGGNHKLAPRLSPKKSWEGLAGGTVLSILVALLLRQMLGDRLHVGGHPLLGIAGAVCVGALLAALGLVGDLGESALKRAAGVKDSGATIPGMGGVLDLLDSLMLVFPLFYVFLGLS